MPAGSFFSGARTDHIKDVQLTAVAPYLSLRNYRDRLRGTFARVKRGAKCYETIDIPTHDSNIHVFLGYLPSVSLPEVNLPGASVNCDIL